MVCSMTGNEFIKQISKIGRERGVEVHVDTERGKGSHCTLEFTMRFTYPARLQRCSADEVLVSFRDLPECLTSGADEAKALAEAADALEEAVAGRLNRTDELPVPSARRAGEYLVAVPPITAAKAALWLAMRDSGLSLAELARRLGVEEKRIRRMLNPRHRSAIDGIDEALRILGKEIVVETRAA